MSHNFYLQCVCGAEHGSGYNNGEEALRDAVENSWPLVALLDAGWDISDVVYQGQKHQHYAKVGGFIANHVKCGGFLIQDEYARDAPIKVRPKAPPHEFVPMVGLELKAEIEKLQARVMELKEIVSDISDDKR